MRPLWTPDELVAATGGAMDRRFAATGLSIDTRTLCPGDLFIALHGDHRDGHCFVADALARGAAGALVDRPIAGLAADAPLLAVRDTLASLSALGAFARARFGGQAIAITGSVGKTTTKEMLRTILEAEGPTHAARASYNNHWGLPLTLAGLAADAAFCICEIGMNHAGEIAPLARLARPHLALITAIERAHIGHLGSIEAIADEKAAIAAGLEPGGALVLPADSPLHERLRHQAGAARIVTFGTVEAADTRLCEAGESAAASRVAVAIDGRPIHFRLPAPGRHMALNATASLAAAVALGVDPARAAHALEGFTALAGRGLVRLLAVAGGTLTLLDESYNANAASVRAALAVLGLQQAGRRIAVLGDMLELGAEAESEHMALAPDILGATDALFACGPAMRHLFEKLPNSHRGAHAPDAASLASIVAAAARPGDAILVKGSLASRMQLVVAALQGLAERG